MSIVLALVMVAFAEFRSKSDLEPRAHDSGRVGSKGLVFDRALPGKNVECPGVQWTDDGVVNDVPFPETASGVWASVVDRIEARSDATDRKHAICDAHDCVFSIDEFTCLRNRAPITRCHSMLSFMTSQQLRCSYRRLSAFEELSHACSMH
jgi:hypothetical protein